MNRNKLSEEYPCEIRVSPRARRVKLAFRPYRGLEIVIPRRFPRREIPRILQQHEAWISEQFSRHGHSLRRTGLPDRIDLALTGESFPIEYRNHNKCRIAEIDGSLLIRHEADDQSIALLRRWLRDKAKRQLKPMLEKLSQETDLPFNQCSIRGQKSRWGSCSSRGNISLNEQLLFMPGATVRYLMIHELCHTRHLNHSPSFWRLVESLEPDFREYERALDCGRKRIPAWYMQSLYA